MSGPASFNSWIYPYPTSGMRGAYSNGLMGSIYFWSWLGNSIIGDIPIPAQKLCFEVIACPSDAQVVACPSTGAALAYASEASALACVSSGSVEAKLSEATVAAGFCP